MRNIFLFRERKTTDSYVGKKKLMYRMEIYYVEHGKLRYKNKNPMAFLTVYEGIGFGWICKEINTQIHQPPVYQARRLTTRPSLLCPIVGNLPAYIPSLCIERT